MLNSDVFFLFPPGYSGNYLQWILNVSEQDSSATTIKDPLLSDGTSHGFIRKPTHLSLIRLTQWMLKNSPQNPQTYIINTYDHHTNWTQHAAYGASYLLHAKPKCNIVSIYAKTDDEIKYGALNCYTKWPTYLELHSKSGETAADPWSFNTPTLKDRNYFYKNWKTDFPISSNFFWDEFEYNINFTKTWYEGRNKLQPWEVNETEYVFYDKPPTDRILRVTLSDILKDTFLQDTFIPWIENQNIGKFNWNHALNYHSTYVQAQKNAKWFTAIDDFRKTKKIDKFLLSNSLSQALLLEELQPNLNQINGWEEMSTEQILEYLNYSV